MCPNKVSIRCYIMLLLQLLFSTQAAEKTKRMIAAEYGIPLTQPRELLQQQPKSEFGATPNPGIIGNNVHQGAALSAPCSRPVSEQQVKQSDGHDSRCSDSGDTDDEDAAVLQQAQNNGISNSSSNSSSGVLMSSKTVDTGSVSATSARRAAVALQVLPCAMIASTVLQPFFLVLTLQVVICFHATCPCSALVQACLLIVLRSWRTL